MDFNKGYPKNVGILAIDIYFPNTYVDQKELEVYNGVSEGKYTIGLGQHQMAVCTDREDIHSICLTVTKQLMDKHSISGRDVGFLMVGTETLIDKSKSVKTVLMQLFAESGNTDIEGIHSTNACYGGTDALFRAWDWVESSSWDGRYAIVVAADIAIYARGSARPTGGCGAVAMLVGPDAAIVFDRKVRSTHMTHVYDFYKPDMSSEYPTVDGHLSIRCYKGALDKCYQLYMNKTNKHGNNISLDSFDGVLFHAPYCKLVQKSMARLYLLNYLQIAKNNKKSIKCEKELDIYKNAKLEDTYDNMSLEKHLIKCSKRIFESKTDPALMLTRCLGNMYTASLYASLISYLLSKPISNLVNNKVLFFSYGSGLASSMFSAQITSDPTVLSRLMAGIGDIGHRLSGRHKVSPQIFDGFLKLRELCHNRAPYMPTGPLEHLGAGSFYLTLVNENYQRKYECHVIDKH